MPQDFLLLQQLLGVGSGWVQATLLAGLFLVLVFRPERIRSWVLFSLACWCFALSVLVPPLINLLFATLSGALFGGTARGLGNLGGSPLVTIGVILCGPALFGLSLLFALLSLMPGRTYPFQPPKHPLE